MRIIVTGGLGFIGSSFVNLLENNTDFDILVIDKETYAANRDNNKSQSFQNIDTNGPQDLKSSLLRGIVNNDVNLVFDKAVEACRCGDVSEKQENYHKALADYSLSLR